MNSPGAASHPRQDGVTQLSIAVIVPSYRRPASLERCLRALQEQTLKPRRIVVSIRQGDSATRLVVESARERMPHLSFVSVTEPGVIAAMAAAIAECDEDVIACTDDDAIPRSNWIEGLDSYYGDGVGAVGGRDVIHDHDGSACDAMSVETLKTTVGRLPPIGRLIGNHHIGCGPAREVDVLKGVNMSMRRELWQLDETLKGSGAQVAWEVGICLKARAEGWRIIYDPALQVGHYPAERFDEDQRYRCNIHAQANAAWNEAYGLACHLPPVRLVVVGVITFALGCRTAPGPALLPILLVQAPKRPGFMLRLSYAVTLARVQGVISGVRKRTGSRRLTSLAAWSVSGLARRR